MKVSEVVSLLRTSGETVKMEVTAGPFEIGEVRVHEGQAWHAEVPGTEGFAALTLIVRLPACVVRFRPLAEPGPRTITAGHQPPLEVLDDEARRAFARARVAGRLEIGQLPANPRLSVGDLSLPPDAVPTSGEFSLNATSPAEREALERFEAAFRRGTQAYLRHQFDVAREAFEECLKLRPQDRRVLHNLERLRNRTS